MATHARLSPSNSRWPHCPGSVREEANYPDSSGAAAIDGTGSHLLLETCLKTGDPNVKAARFIGQTIGIGHEDMPEGWVIDAERAARVQIALDYIQHRDSEIGGVTVTTETQVNPGAMFQRNDWFGTCDVTLQGIEAPVIEVIDYKDGQMFVAADNNTQLVSYATGVCFARNVTSVANPVVRMTIIQPKITKQPIRFTEMTLQELSDQAAKLHKAACATDDPNAPLVAGDHCTWCKHKEACAERTAKGLDGIGMMVESSSPLFETLQSGQLSVEDMPAEKLAAILDAKPIIEALLKNVDKEVETRLKAGEDVPGYTMGTGRGSNVWIDDQELVEKKLRGMRFVNADIYPPKFVSPAQALKKADLTDRQKKRIEKELIVYVDGKPKVVKSNFKRQTAEEMFAEPAPIIEITAAPAEPTTESFDDLSFL